MPSQTIDSGIRDNHRRGLVADFLKSKIRHGSRLSVVSAYFTIYAYEALRDQLDEIDHLDFLFGEPRFIASLDPEKTEKKAFILDDHGLLLANRLQQKRVARECAAWIREKVDIRSVRHAQLLHGKTYHIANAGVEEAKDVTPARDAKLKELKRLIERKVKNPTTNKLGQPNRKVLVFTAFADTAAYLFHELASWAHRDLGIHIALVAGSGDNHTTFGKSDFNQILTNFSPRSKNRAKIPSMPQTEEIDLLIATDCISEGQNLQDCDLLINYDIHWNPVRIIQRFGRIDRIGSVNNAVQLVNFWPTQDLEKYVNLKNRVEARMALVDIAATFEDNILKTDEIEELVHEDLRYRDKQLLRLREEVLDLEDFSESVALNEFTLDDFRIELTKYIEANRQLLQDAPLGLYAVVPPHPEHQVIAPGVIFCLKQKGGAPSGDTVNPLQPYWGIGERISQRIASDGWGNSTIVSLAAYIRRRDPNARGFSAQNLWRMRQFYETWRGENKLSPLVRELTWTNNLLIMGKCKRSQEREFYLRLAVREHWAKRQLERQIDSALFERIVLSPAKLSPALRVLHPQAPRTPLHRCAFVRHQGQPSRGIRLEPFPFPRPHRRIPDRLTG
jgi:hypothetical protein